MTREELERRIEDRVTKGEMCCGLYDTGLWYVYVYLNDVDADVCFEWFDNAMELDESIDDDKL